jgi:hypothetical protein
LIARRARWFVLSNLVMAVALLALALLNVGYQVETGGPAWVAVLLVAMVAVYAWQVARQLLDQQPIVAVLADGLALPTATSEPIAWSRIQGVTLGGLITRNQIDITLDNALITQLTLGQRFLGDSVVKRRGLVPGITILASNLDQRAPAIVAAIRRRWPAAESPSG